MILPPRKMMAAKKSTQTRVVHTQLTFAMVLAHAKVLFYSRYLAKTCLQCFQPQIGAGKISPNHSPTVLT